MGLTAEKFDRICCISGIPNMTELGIFPPCGLNTVLQIFTQMAQDATDQGREGHSGRAKTPVLSISDGWAAVFKIEAITTLRYQPIRARQVLAVSCVMSSPWGHGLLPAQCPALRYPEDTDTLSCFRCCCRYRRLRQLYRYPDCRR